MEKQLLKLKKCLLDQLETKLILKEHYRLERKWSEMHKYRGQILMIHDTLLCIDHEDHLDGLMDIYEQNKD